MLVSTILESAYQAQLHCQGQAPDLEDSTTPAPPRRHSMLTLRNSFSLPL